MIAKYILCMGTWNMINESLSSIAPPPIESLFITCKSSNLLVKVGGDVEILFDLLTLSLSSPVAFHLIKKDGHLFKISV